VLAEGDPLPPEHDRVPDCVRALDQLYRAEQPALVRFTARHIELDQAEDVVQQLFVRLAAHRDTPAIATPGRYLRQALRNIVTDHRRAAQCRAGDRHIPIDEVEIAGPDPIKALEARDRLRRIEEAVSRLKPLTQQIFLACRLDGYSYAEIAEQTGLSIRGVEKQMSRAIKQLGRHLRQHD
jgi:RNA polymerase sigma factor (sigma-70 family)